MDQSFLFFTGVSTWYKVTFIPVYIRLDNDERQPYKLLKTVAEGTGDDNENLISTKILKYVCECNPIITFTENSGSYDFSFYEHVDGDTSNEGGYYKEVLSALDIPDVDIVKV